MCAEEHPIFWSSAHSIVLLPFCPHRSLSALFLQSNTFFDLWKNLVWHITMRVTVPQTILYIAMQEAENTLPNCISMNIFTSFTICFIFLNIVVQMECILPCELSFWEEFSLLLFEVFSYLSAEITFIFLQQSVFSFAYC